MKGIFSFMDLKDEQKPIEQGMTTLDTICAVESYIILSLLILIQTVVFCKIKCRVEKLGIFILATYSISSITHCINWFLYTMKQNQTSNDFQLLMEYIIDMIDEIPVILTWTMLYYFIFEMKDLRDKLECQNVKEYNLKK